MDEFQVSCINKPDRQSTHEHITHIGNNALDWRMTREEAIRRIEAKECAFYTLDVFNNKAYVGVVRPGNGRAPYLRTYADGKWTDNLLALAECGTNCKLV